MAGIAYSDLIPVIDGDVAIDTMPSGHLRNATWRSHVVAPGRTCLMCNRQLDAAQVGLDIEGLLDDPDYIVGQADNPNQRAGQNVATVSINAAASLLAQYISLSVGPRRARRHWTTPIPPQHSRVAPPPLRLEPALPIRSRRSRR